MDSSKCHHCKRKSHILIDCKCSLKVCMKCKDPEQHGCTFDYKLVARYRLAINNPKVEAKKVEVI